MADGERRLSRLLRGDRWRYFIGAVLLALIAAGLVALWTSRDTAREEASTVVEANLRAALRVQSLETCQRGNVVRATLRAGYRDDVKTYVDLARLMAAGGDGRNQPLVDQLLRAANRRADLIAQPLLQQRDCPADAALAAAGKAPPAPPAGERPAVPTAAELLGLDEDPPDPAAGGAGRPSDGPPAGPGPELPTTTPRPSRPPLAPPPRPRPTRPGTPTTPPAAPTPPTSPVAPPPAPPPQPPPTVAENLVDLDLALLDLARLQVHLLPELRVRLDLGGGSAP